MCLWPEILGISVKAPTLPTHRNVQTASAPVFVHSDCLLRTGISRYQQPQLPLRTLCIFLYGLRIIQRSSDILHYSTLCYLTLYCIFLLSLSNAQLSSAQLQLQLRPKTRSFPSCFLPPCLTRGRFPAPRPTPDRTGPQRRTAEEQVREEKGRETGLPDAE